ncbi:MAG: exonuclease SbcCD subunit D C-terminal domain-containing protein [Treponema sp.]|jgi:exonuclease SbcD|nr:exonuclease SbcCD subunit D C-terminal domain-containing protein [Treponema sp.]
MKLLHTADIHLGKVLHEHSLIEDQRHMLQTLLAILKDPSFNALVIAGDVYDRSIPPPDAVKLLGPFLGQLKKECPAVEVFLISGNHDSASRLGFGRELFAELGVHVGTEPENASTPVVVTVGQEKTAFFMLPFLAAGSLKSELTREDGQEPAPLRSQASLAKEAAARLEKARCEAIENGADNTALVAHLFASGGVSSQSERTFLGNAELVDINLFSGFDYIALGHLHTFQQAGEKAFYSGSPLAYSFSEAGRGKAFLAVTLEKGKTPLVEPIPITPLRKMTRIKGEFASFLRGDAADEASAAAQAAASDYLEITLTGTALVENPLSLLSRRFPYLLRIDQSAAVNMRLRERTAVLKTAYAAHTHTMKKNDIVDDFSAFLGERYGAEDAYAEELALFKDMLLETEAES